MTTIFLTHDPGAASVYYGDAALAALRELAEVRLNPTGGPLGKQALIEAAAGCELFVGDVNTPAEGAVFDALPDLVAFHRCAVDRRTIDVAAASRNGVPVTNAGPGFVDSVTELVFGLMIGPRPRCQRRRDAVPGGQRSASAHRHAAHRGDARRHRPPIWCVAITSGRPPSETLETVEQVRAVLAGRMPQNPPNPEHATRLVRFQSRQP